MVEGFSPINTVFVDLDGTMIKGNSMKLFMVWLPLRLLKKRRFPDFLRTVSWIALRAARLTSHKRMKWNLTRIARTHLSDSDWNSIATRVLTHVNPDVDIFISKEKRNGARICLATAAPEEYASIIAETLDMEYCLATVFTPYFSDYSENKGDIKLDAIQDLMTNENLDMSAFLTDHHDDLPVMKAFPEQTILISPSRKTRTRFDSQKALSF